MSKWLIRIAPLKFGVALAAVHSMFALIGVPFYVLREVMSAGGTTSPTHHIYGTSVAGAFIVYPLFYGVVGFIFGVISAAIYNLVAKFTGGIEISLSDTRGGK